MISGESGQKNSLQLDIDELDLLVGFTVQRRTTMIFTIHVYSRLYAQA